MGRKRICGLSTCKVQAVTAAASVNQIHTKSEHLVVVKITMKLINGVTNRRTSPKRAKIQVSHTTLMLFCVSMDGKLVV